MECGFIFKNEVSQKTIDTYLSIEVKYNEQDHHIYTINGGGECVLLINENSFGLNVDIETKRISGFSDYLPHIQKLQEKDIPTLKDYLNGILVLNTTAELHAGTGYHFKTAKCLYFDKLTKNFLIGNANYSKPFFRFLKNAYCQLDDSGNITAIIITDILDK